MALKYGTTQGITMHMIWFWLSMHCSALRRSGYADMTNYFTFSTLEQLELACVVPWEAPFTYHGYNESIRKTKIGCLHCVRLI